MKVKVKKISEGAVLPFYATEGAAGMDLTATGKEYDSKGCVVYGTGLAFEIPEGYAGFIFPRSSNYKSGLLLTNCVGIVDSGYRGEVMAKFVTRLNYPSYEDENKSKIRHIYDEDKTYNIGDRVAQMVILPYPKVEFVEVDELSNSDRGDGGYGSTGR
jgi:dUTP pyrophosphatase